MHETCSRRGRFLGIFKQNRCGESIGPGAPVYGKTLERFSRYRERFKWLIDHCEEFREVCRDYEGRLGAMENVHKSPGGSEERLVAEYRETQKKLDEEMIPWLTDECFYRVLGRFPGAGGRIMWLIRNCEEFRDLCRSYDNCLNSIEDMRNSTGDFGGRVAEFQVTLQKLDCEIGARLESS
jgi:hypothetical protein